MLWLAVAFGGALGALLRLLVRVAEQHFVADSSAINLPLPLATLAVNLLGSIVIGVFLALSWNREPHPQFDAFFVTGLLGGFTTFSTFSREVVQLAAEGQPAMAATYAAAGALLPVLGAFFGFWLAR